jgi:Bacteriodetes cell division protein (FtsL-like)
MAKQNWKQILNISGKTTDFVFGNLRFIMFLGGLTLIYITNALHAERKIHEMQHLEREIKELKWDYMTVKRDVLYRSMQSQMDGNVEHLGLNLSTTGPRVIRIK